MKERSIVLKIAYDGTDYAGWQVQHSGLAIANILERKYAATFGETITLIGASRTDAGVHALGQVAQFTSSTDVPLNALHYGWNKSLPKSIIIRKLTQIDHPFHARYDATKKIYHYYISRSRLMPFASRYVYHFEHNLDLDKVQKTLKLFVGTHDFSSFSGNAEKKNSIRTIDSATLSYIKSLRVYRISIEGRSFLHHMVRRIVGATLYIGSYNHIKPELITKLLYTKDQHHMLPNAPAHGLVLHKVFYTQEVL